MGAQGEPDVPLIGTVDAYWGYLTMSILGFLWDLIDVVRLPLEHGWGGILDLLEMLLFGRAEKRGGVSPLAGTGFQDFFISRMYLPVSEPWNRPVCSAPDAYIDVAERSWADPAAGDGAPSSPPQHQSST